MSRINPVYMVRINGRSLTSAVDPRTIQLEHTELGDGGRELLIVVSNPGLELLDDPDFQEGNEIEWRFGYEGNLSPVYKSTLYITEPTFDAWSGLTLKLFAYDAIATALSRVKQTVWRKEDEAKITQSEVVEMVAESLGLEASVEPTKNYVTEIAQSGTYWSFLRQLAKDAVAENPQRRQAYRTWFDAESKTLYFKPAPLYNQATKVYRFMTENQDPTLISFRPKIDTSKPDNAGAANTKTRDIDGNGEVVDEEATAEDSDSVKTGRYNLRGGGESYEAFEYDETGEVKTDPSSSDPTSTDAQSRAGANQAEKELKGIEADITVIGDPTVRANDIVEVTNVGQKLSGNYLCDKVIHNISGDGYKTVITALKDALPTDAAGNRSEAGGPEGGTEDEEDASETVVIRNETDYTEEWEVTTREEAQRRGGQ